MGNDIDICSKDEQLDSILSQHFGPSNESNLEFFRRNYAKFCDSVGNPERKMYTTANLESDCARVSILPLFEVTEFKAKSGDNTLHSVFWKRKAFNERISSVNNTCIIYFHTNTNCCMDALEVLPAAQLLNAHILSFDLPGCGKSEGKVTIDLTKEIELYIDWAKVLLGEAVHIVLWARGMSTGPVIEFASKLCDPHRNVKAAVLDSPYTSIQQMITDYVERVYQDGYAIPRTALNMCVRMVASSMASRIGGGDPLKVKPMQFVQQCRLPCYVLAAMSDDYISPKQGEEIACSWSGPVCYKAFDGRHFGVRTSEMIVNIANFLLHQCEITVLADEDALAAILGTSTNTDNANAKNNTSSSSKSTEKKEASSETAPSADRSAQEISTTASPNSVAAYALATDRTAQDKANSKIK